MPPYWPPWRDGEGWLPAGVVVEPLLVDDVVPVPPAAVDDAPEPAVAAGVGVVGRYHFC
jgi:hypothetical protein